MVRLPEVIHGQAEGQMFPPTHGDTAPPVCNHLAPEILYHEISSSDVDGR